MATIEERAEKYENNYPDIDDPYYSYYVRNGYIKGATDQKQIDIEKAYKWLKNNLINENDPQRAMWRAFINEFKKAMEK